MWETRIYYGDTDAGGVVYYANYLNYFEKSWFEYLAKRGFSLADYAKEGIYFIVKNVKVDYHSSARYGEILQIHTKVCEVTKASFTFHHRVMVKESGKIIAEGKNQMVCITSEGKPKRLPAEFLQRLK